MSMWFSSKTCSSSSILFVKQHALVRYTLGNCFLLAVVPVGWGLGGGGSGGAGVVVLAASSVVSVLGWVDGGSVVGVSGCNGVSNTLLILIPVSV